MKKLVKRLGKNEVIRSALFFLIALYIRLIHVTSRWTVVGLEYPAPFWRERKPFIPVFWHNRMMLMPYAWENPQSNPVSILASGHRDGQFMVKVMAYFHIGTITGSAHRGGTEALRIMLKRLKAGEWVGLTPDGPKGPRYRVKPGVVTLARMSGLPIIPATHATSRRKVVKSWDRFMVPLPFSRAVYVWGPPIYIARDEDEEAARLRVEAALTEVTSAADRLCGHDPISPGDTP
ncbi:MAG: hypothetical protein A2516_01705 [Alphaproteobacteria bacterium RIFOXYD12_FULL_60_8]|nr:MAG: hypothetical protein A2516_01705 [Alphaproteobacteria bacterium RIFOXYD12_FULL_60_8]